MLVIAVITVLIVALLILRLASLRAIPKETYLSLNNVLFSFCCGVETNYGVQCLEHFIPTARL